jgi:hypothetical protein
VHHLSSPPPRFNIIMATTTTTPSTVAASTGTTTTTGGTGTGTGTTRKAPDYSLDDPELVAYCEKNETELRFKRWSSDVGECQGRTEGGKDRAQNRKDERGTMPNIDANPKR